MSASISRHVFPYATPNDTSSADESRDLAGHLLGRLEAHGFDFFTGVPCSYMASLLRRLEAQPLYGYVNAVREDAAIGIATGAYLGGRQPVVLMQNSGLGVSVNALASLTHIYRIPLLLLVTWRGENGQDAPEHLVMGEQLLALLRVLTVPFQIFDPALIEEHLSDLTDTMRVSRRPVAWIIRKGFM
jgi:sulfopyruvate decarboxylase subunit alpha